MRYFLIGVCDQDFIDSVFAVTHTEMLKIFKDVIYGKTDSYYFYPVVLRELTEQEYMQRRGDESHTFEGDGSQEDLELFESVLAAFKEEYGS